MAGVTIDRSPSGDTTPPVASPAQTPAHAPLPPLTDAASRVLDAALELFYRQGALATTVRQITSACGLTPGAFYNHFQSKEDLLYRLVERAHLRVEHEVAERQAQVAGDPLAELDAIVRVYVEMIALRRQNARVANRDYLVLADDLRERIVVLRRRLRDRVAAVLLAGDQQGVFHLLPDGPEKGASAVLTAVALMDMCVQISEWYHEGYGLDPSDLAARYSILARRLAGASTETQSGQA